MSTAWYIHRRGDSWIAIEHEKRVDWASYHLFGRETGKLVGFLTLHELEEDLRSRGLSVQTMFLLESKGSP